MPTKTYTDEKEFQKFTTAMTNFRLKEAEKLVHSSNASTNQYKDLIISFVQEIENTDSDKSKNRCADIIETWSYNISNDNWQQELVLFCKEHKNIKYAYLIVNDNKKEFIIVMDDATDESVLEYNAYGFELRKEYENIYDFMVLDASMVKDIESMFDMVKKIYERGI